MKLTSTIPDTSRRGICILFIGLLVVFNGNKQACSQLPGKVSDLLREYSDDIAMQESLVERGMGSPAGAAISYRHRGQVYLLYAQRPRQAVADFSEAIRLLESTQLDDRSRSTLADSWVFRSQAHHQLKHRSIAISDATAAIRLFEEMVQHGAQYAKPTLVYALKRRIEALVDTVPSVQPSDADLRQALADIDQAIPLLEEQTTKGSDAEFFQSELTQLKERRASVSEAVGERRTTAGEDTPDRKSTATHTSHRRDVIDVVAGLLFVVIVALMLTCSLRHLPSLRTRNLPSLSTSSGARSSSEDRAGNN